MDYKLIKFILLWLLFCFFVMSCELKKLDPAYDISSPNINIKVTPNKKIVKLGDTLNFRVDISDMLPITTGGTKKIDNGNLSFIVGLYKLGKTGLEGTNNTSTDFNSTLPTDLIWKANIGTIETGTINKPWRCTAKYVSDRYILDFHFIPTIKDTFLIDVRDGYLTLPSYSQYTRPYFNFLGNENQHLEIVEDKLKLPQNEYGTRQRGHTYAFIVE